MGKMVLLGNAKEINKDVELCRTTNERICNQVIQFLMANQIPFTKNLIHIPFFLRERFHGASQICIIMTNRNCYSQARQTLDQLDHSFRRRLIVSNY